MKKGLILMAMLTGVIALGFSQTALSGTYRYSANSYITFTGSNFTGQWSRTDTMSGTFSVSGSRLTLNITGGTKARNTWVWTVVDANTLRDQDGDSWRKEGGSQAAAPQPQFVLSGTYRENSGRYITFTGSNFTGTLGIYTISGTFSVSSNRLTLNITGGTLARHIWTEYFQWTIVDANTIRNQDGSGWTTGRTAEDYSNSGAEARDRGDYDQAIVDFTAAIRLNPSAYSYNSRGITYLQKGDYDRAIADCTEAIRLGYNNGWTYNTRGLAYEKKGNYSLALTDFIATLRLDTTNQYKAEESIERVLAAAPNLADPRVLRTVNNAASWIEAVNGIRSGGENKVHSITISGNFTIPMSDSNTFGSVAKIAVILGGNGTISPSSNGSLLQIGNEQTVIVKDLTLRGRDNNNRSVVVIERGGLFRMEGNSTVTGNITGSYNWLYGGGVYVNGGTFVMQDNTSVTGNTINGASWDSGGGGVYVTAKGSFYMNDNASVTGNTANEQGGGVYVNDGYFYMWANTSISGNTAGPRNGKGGGVYSNGDFYMYGNASVLDNTIGGVYVAGGNFYMQDNTSVSGNNSSGVYVGRGLFTMSGNASVSDNTGTGVYSKGTFTMRGNASVSNNTTSQNGGGVHNDLGTFIMESGTISGNTASRVGGGVYSFAGNFTMQGGTISGNTAGESGGGVYSKTDFTMQNGNISGNIAGQYGGGVYVDYTFNMQGGVISGNTANEQGGGVYSSRTFTKTGGTIYGNDADQNLRNILTNNNGRGYAIYDNRNSRWRSATAGSTMNTDTYGFWLND